MRSLVRGNSKGQSLVEMALLLPCLLLLFAGLMDLARGYQSYVMVSNAAFVGARYGAVNPSDTSGIQTRIYNALTGSGCTVTSIDISYPSGNAPRNPIQVRVQATLPTMLGSILGRTSLVLSRTATLVIF